MAVCLLTAASATCAVPDGNVVGGTADNCTTTALEMESERYAVGTECDVNCTRKTDHASTPTVTCQEGALDAAGIWTTAQCIGEAGVGQRGNITHYHDVHMVALQDAHRHRPYKAASGKVARCALRHGCRFQAVAPSTVLGTEQPALLCLQMRGWFTAALTVLLAATCPAPGTLVTNGEVGDCDPIAVDSGRYLLGSACTVGCTGTDHASALTVQCLAAEAEGAAWTTAQCTGQCASTATVQLSMKMGQQCQATT